jgi:hypothetical protein
MAYKVKKTEHAGSKKGCGAYYGRKRDAKRESTRTRRRTTRKLMQAEPADDPFLAIVRRAKPSPKGRTPHTDIHRISA